MHFRYVAEALFQTLETMKEIVQREVFVHCIGNSLGAHICGFTGKLIKHKLKQNPESSNDSILDRISALDPAGPLFFNDVPEYPNKIKSGARISSSDALLVDVIHTDGIVRDPFQYGTLVKAGTVDFYIGANGAYGGNQPGCSCEFCNLCGCSHHKSHEYFIASIKVNIYLWVF